MKLNYGEFLLVTFLTPFLRPLIAVVETETIKNKQYKKFKLFFFAGIYVYVK